MQAHTSSNENYPDFKYQDESKHSNDGLISFIENDLVLNFLNDDTHNKVYQNMTSFQYSNTSDIDQQSVYTPLNNNKINMSEGNGINMNGFFANPGASNFLNFQMDGLPGNYALMRGPHGRGSQKLNGDLMQTLANNSKIKEELLLGSKAEEKGSKKEGDQIEKVLDIKQLLNIEEKLANKAKSTYTHKITNLLMTNPPAQKAEPKPPANKVEKSESDFIAKHNMLFNKMMEEKKGAPGAEPEAKKLPVLKEQMLANLKTASTLDDENSTTLNYSSNLRFEHEKEIYKLNEKLEKNRESARNSRKRKKIYIELLETKVQALTEELENCKKMLDFATRSKKSDTHSKIIENLYAEKKLLFEKLHRAMNNCSGDNEIRLIVDSLRLRLGASGKERLNLMESCFKKIAEMVVPNYIRYLLWIADEGLDIFNLDNNLNINDPSKLDDEGVSGFLQALHLSDSQKRNILKFKNKFVQDNQKMSAMMKNLYDLKHAMQQLSQTIETSMDQFRNIFTPTQIGNFIFKIEKDPNKGHFSARKLWLKNLEHYNEELIMLEDESESHKNEAARLEEENANPGNQLDENLSFMMEYQHDFMNKMRKKRHSNEDG